MIMTVNTHSAKWEELLIPQIQGAVYSIPCPADVKLSGPLFAHMGYWILDEAQEWEIRFDTTNGRAFDDKNGYIMRADCSAHHPEAFSRYIFLSPDH